MQIILFTPPSDRKILDGEKTMTARYWKRKPPKVGDLIAAQTEYSKSTRFAILKIKNVFKWHISVNFSIFFLDDILGGWKVPSKRKLKNIAIQEGFDLWINFLHEYHRLNANKFDKFSSPKRTHYFIEFELVEDLS